MLFNLGHWTLPDLDIAQLVLWEVQVNRVGVICACKQLSEVPGKVLAGCDSSAGNEDDRLDFAVGEGQGK